jgi:hypothetical protein
MAQKFFLFKRKDPAVSGGAVFSDNGKGISVISFPASNLAYMAANRGAVTMYFNDSAPFEENSLTLAGESFEKTSVTVSCESGGEADLMEEIINFINRDTAKNVMKFDATGAENTFGAKTAKPTIDARVRARPVERGLVGTDAIITGLDANAVINGIDFLTADNLPYVDYEVNDINLGVGNLITLNTGTDYTIPNGVGGGLTADPIGDYPPLLKDSDKICSKKTLEFNPPGRLEVGVNITSGIVDNITGANLTDSVGATSSIVRGGSPLSGDLADGGIPSAQRPTFTVSTDASANITDFKCTYAGVNLQVGDVITALFADGTVVLTVSGVHFPSEIESSEMSFLNQTETQTAVTPPLPHEDYTIFFALVRPNRSLLDPIYTHFSSGNRTSTFSECMGPFPYRSLGDQFQFNHNDPTAVDSGLNTPKKESLLIKSSESFSEYVRSSEAVESSKDNLECMVVRKTKTGAIYVYDNSGEQIGYQPSNVDPDGVIVTGRFGLPLPFSYDSPTLRIARFGAISKDIGDLACRNLATQLFNRFKVPLDE